MDFDPILLLPAYVRARLVPFVGSGMSMGPCVDWESLVRNLEKKSGTEHVETEHVEIDGPLTQRAFHAIHNLRYTGRDVAEAIREAVYMADNTKSKRVPPQTRALAGLFWPLVCTTNYDDIYVRARARQRSRNGEKPRPLPVVGRSDADCRRVLRHISFPDSELVWALQGFLRPRDCDLMHPDSLYGPYRLENELVVGHAEYRRVAHREPHFRRCFSEVFRKSTLLFLGSGLAEPYFLGLFDEIMELTGPPEFPHFAFVESGKVDQDFMRKRYHILCMTYPAGEHNNVECYLKEFTEAVNKRRLRHSGWGYRANSPPHVNRCTTGDSLRVVRGVLPDPSRLGSRDGIAISCGRTPARNGRGTPIPGAVHKETYVRPVWLGDWTVKWQSPGNCSYGIVARAMDGDDRSPEVTRVAFFESLREIGLLGIDTLHVQLLAAGPGKVFAPWISLVQMARGYGQWIRTCRNGTAMTVHVYVVDPAVLGLLHGSFLDLTEHIEAIKIRIGVEVIDASGAIERYDEIVDPDEKVATIVNLTPHARGKQPTLSAQPAPRRGQRARSLSTVGDVTVQEFGLVHGSTLIVDFRKRRGVGLAGLWRYIVRARKPPCRAEF